MKIAVGFTLAALATLAPAFAAPGRMDVSKRAPTVSTEDEVVLPENKPIERNEVLEEKRSSRDTSKDTYEKKEAVVGDRRSTINVEESREKKLYVTPDRKEYDKVEHKESHWNGKESRFSTSDDAYRSKVAVRFQDKIGDASPVSTKVKPAVEQRTTFDKINRFVFRKNGDQTIQVNVAGSEKAGEDISDGYSPANAKRAGSDNDTR